MRNANQTEEGKAMGRSISFHPASLHKWAEKYGAGQTPKLGVSAVVCTALNEFRARVEPSSSKEAQLIAAARKVGIDDAIDVLAKCSASKRRQR